MVWNQCSHSSKWVSHWDWGSGEFWPAASLWLSVVRKMIRQWLTLQRVYSGYHIICLQIIHKYAVNNSSNISPKTSSKFNLLINARKRELFSLSHLKQINLLLPCVSWSRTRTQPSNICIRTSGTSGSGTETCRQTWCDFIRGMVTFIFNKWSVSINHRLYTKDGRGCQGVTISLWTFCHI